MSVHISNMFNVNIEIVKIIVIRINLIIDFLEILMQ